MNPKYHGDAKDLFKRGMLSLLRECSAIRNLRVLSLFTDEYQPLDVVQYARILGVDESALVSRERFYPKQGRSEYLAVAAEAGRTNDLFLDPDKGLVVEASESNRKKVITTDEVSVLIPADSQCLAAIYDESIDRSDPERSIAEKLESLQTLGLSAFAYFNASPNTPSVVFVARREHEERLRKLATELRELGIPKSKLRPIT